MLKSLSVALLLIALPNTASLWVAAPALAQVEPADADRDGVEDGIDSCPLVFNPDQKEPCLDAPVLRSSQEVPSLGADLFYDVDFGTPPHTVGSPPVVGLGPIPRDTPSNINFGAPIVVAAEGVLDQQPLRFGSGTGTFDQISFGISDGGLPGDLPHYHFEMTVMMVSSGELSIFFDAPFAHSIKFTSGNQIRAVTLGDGSYNTVIGEWEPGVARRLVVDIDQTIDEWTIALDGTEVFSGFFNISNMRMLRPSANRGTIAAMDDIIVSDAPPLSASPLGVELIGQTGFIGLCKNNTTGAVVVSAVPLGTTLDCTALALGLPSSPGDVITVYTIGTADSATLFDNGPVGESTGSCSSNNCNGGSRDWEFLDDFILGEDSTLTSLDFVDQGPFDIDYESTTWAIYTGGPFTAPIARDTVVGTLAAVTDSQWRVTISGLSVALTAGVTYWLGTNNTFTSGLSTAVEASPATIPGGFYANDHADFQVPARGDRAFRLFGTGSPSVGAELTGQTGFIGFCKNNTTGAVVVSAVPLGTTLDCTALGLFTSPADVISVYTIGTAD